ncbi:DNA polymerase III polC-type [[Mycoplasma] cavipharyngis]|uniref:PolC-type DNA polymerase III n=1 Tax=[Mycoplasma] cavipharyngis TaxID=92757 RepID=UPI00370446A4
MNNFWNYKDTLLSLVNYNNIIKKYLTQELCILKTSDFDDLTKVATIYFQAKKFNEIHFHLKFDELPVYQTFKTLLMHKNHLCLDQTKICFSWNTQNLFNPKTISNILELYLLDQFPNNPLTLSLATQKIQLENDLVTFVFDNQNSYQGFQFVHSDINKFLSLFFNKNNLNINFVCSFDQEEKTPTTESVKLEVENEVSDVTLSIPLLKIAPLSSEKFYQVWKIETKINFNKSKNIILQIKNDNLFYACLLANKLLTKDCFKKLKTNDWIQIKKFSVSDAKDAKSSDYLVDDFVIVDLKQTITKKESYPNQFANLSLHTKSSSHDGLFTYEDFLATASFYQHKALGITDWNAVTEYPLIEKLAKKYQIKPIYGVELEILNTPIAIAINCDNKTEKISEVSYCIFDIETTGLNALFDDIIEIAVTKFDNHIKVDSYQTFIQTNQKIKPFIQELTKISNEMLDQKGQPIDLALKQFLDFIGDSVLVAHNGINFDLPFLNAKLIENNLKPLSNTLIDTLQVSRAIFSDERSHNLGSLCKRLEIQYDETVAHRADVDVEKLAEVFFKLFDFFPNYQIDLNDDFNQLNLKLQSKELIKRNFSNTICVYAKNQAGIRDLYYLLSLAHTEYFYRIATVNWNIINQKRDNLIVTNAVDNSELWNDVLMNNHAAFSAKIKNYDYVFIPPPQTFAHEINRDNYTLAQVQKAIKLFYQWTIAANKKPIATAMVKYLNPENQNQYSAIVHAKQIGSINHKLFSYQKSNEVLPDYQYRTTDLLISEMQFLNLSKAAMDDLILKNNQSLVDQVDDQIQIIKPKLCAPNLDNDQINFINTAKNNFQKKYGKNPDPFLVKRFNRELDAITTHNFTIIYWASYLLVKKSIEDGFLVASRGSVGSSLIAYLLNISEVNPLPPHYYCHHCQYLEFDHHFANSGFDLEPKSCPKCQTKIYGDGHNIPFETFMGFNADKIPDIDLNFSGLYQLKAHNFLREMFGIESCFRAGTTSSIALKTAYGFARNYYELIKTEPTVGQLEWIVNQIIDVRRTSGQHPGGILVIPKEYSVYDFTPINFPADDLASDWKTTHLKYDYLHDSLLKFDILGHDDPTFLRMLHTLTKIDPRTIPNHDPKVLALFTDCRVMDVYPSQILNETTGAIGLPEFGTQFVRGMLRDANPYSFADLIRISGLSHGTDVWTNNAENLIKKNNLKLNEIISCRDDIMIYLINQKIEPLLAFNIMESVRKGKQIPINAINTLIEHNVPQWYIDSANLIKYMFPKAHAAAYVLMAWRLAFYKLYYPKEYYATYFSIRNDSFDIELLIKNDPELIRDKYRDIKRRMNSKNFTERDSVKTKEKKLLTVYEVALEMLARKIYFANIDLAKSESVDFVPLNQTNKILIPFNAIDGLGQIMANNIVEQRKIKPFISKKDLKLRTKISDTLMGVFEQLKIVDKLSDTNQISIFDV